MSPSLNVTFTNGEKLGHYEVNAHHQSTGSDDKELPSQINGLAVGDDGAPIPTDDRSTTPQASISSKYKYNSMINDYYTINF